MLQQSRLFEDGMSFEHVSSDCTCSGKKCTKCPRMLCVGNFTKDKRLRSGLRSACRDCSNADYKSWRESNKDHDYERHKIYRQENIEKVKEREKRYKHQNRARIRDVESAYRNNHRDQQRKKGIRNYRNHRENILARQREYRRIHLEEIRRRENLRRTGGKTEYTPSMKPYMPKGSYIPMSLKEKRAKWKEYYYAKQEYNNRRAAQWIKENPERHAARQAKRRAFKTQAGGEYTAQEWFDLKEKYNYACLCCGHKEPATKLTADHIVPIIKGGHSNIDNIQPLCRSCNSSKGKNIIDYRRD